jgi:hypothetical protein
MARKAIKNDSGGFRPIGSLLVIDPFVGHRVFLECDRK